MNPVPGNNSVSQTPSLSQSTPPPPSQNSGEEKKPAKSPLLKMQFPKVTKVILPIAIIVSILLVGVGGTYFVAASLFSPKPPPKVASNSSLESESVKLPSPTPTPTVIPTPVVATQAAVLVSPTPVSSNSASLSSYYFSGANLSFQYPSDWFVDLADTSGAPYLHVQNFQPAGKFPANPQKQYAFLIERFDQVGIASLSGLLDVLSSKASNPVMLEGVSMGTPSVLSGDSKVINGYQAYSRTVSYSNFPTSQYLEVYVLDGKSTVVRLVPELDIANGSTYFNDLLKTIYFK